MNNLYVVLSYRGWALAVIRIPKKQSVYSFGPKALMDGLHMITPLLADVAGVATHRVHRVATVALRCTFHFL